MDGVPVVSVRTLLELRVLIPGHRTAGSWFLEQVRLGDHPRHISYVADLRDSDASWLDLAYELQGKAIRLRIHLTTTSPYYGGHRWWFRCPLRQDTEGLGLRVEKLYFPPKASWFGSRIAHSLTYRSCQDSRRFDRIDRLVASRLGMDVQTVRQCMGRGSRAAL